MSWDFREGWLCSVLSVLGEPYFKHNVWYLAVEVVCFGAPAVGRTTFGKLDDALAVKPGDNIYM